MEIKTKHEIEESVYFIDSSSKKPTKNKITGITIFVGKQTQGHGDSIGSKGGVGYYLDGYGDMVFQENSIFKSKEGLMEFEMEKLKEAFKAADAVTNPNTEPF